MKKLKNLTRPAWIFLALMAGLILGITNIVINYLNTL